MAQWVDLLTWQKLKKSRSERMSVPDRPTWGIRATRDFYLLAPPCPLIEPLFGLKIIMKKCSPNQKSFGCSECGLKSVGQ